MWIHRDQEFKFLFCYKRKGYLLVNPTTHYIQKITVLVQKIAKLISLDIAMGLEFMLWLSLNSTNNKTCRVERID